MISSIKVLLVYFSSVHSNLLVFLPQSFQYLSIVNQKRQSLYFLVLTFSSSSLFSCMTVSSVCLCTPCIDLWGFFGNFSQFFKFCLGKQACLYFKSFLLSLDVINPCYYVITKQPLWRYIGTHKPFGNDIAMFLLLMESSSLFA